MYWLILILAGLFEMGWPIGFKIADGATGKQKVLGIVIAVVCIIGSSGLLIIAQKKIPIGTAYAVWTGIGAFGTLVVGILFFNEAATVGKLVSGILIISGVVGLKLFGGH